MPFDLVLLSIGYLLIVYFIHFVYTLKNVYQHREWQKESNSYNRSEEFYYRRAHFFKPYGDKRNIGDGDNGYPLFSIFFWPIALVILAIYYICTKLLVHIIDLPKYALKLFVND